MREVGRPTYHDSAIAVEFVRSTSQNVLEPPAFADAVVDRGEAAFAARVEELGELVFDLGPGLVAYDAKVHDAEALLLVVRGARGPGHFPAVDAAAAAAVVVVAVVVLVVVVVGVGVDLVAARFFAFDRCCWRDGSVVVHAVVAVEVSFG